MYETSRVLLRVAFCVGFVIFAVVDGVAWAIPDRLHLTTQGHQLVSFGSLVGSLILAITTVRLSAATRAWWVLTSAIGHGAAILSPSVGSFIVSATIGFALADLIAEIKQRDRAPIAPG